MWVAQLDTIRASDPNSSKALLDPRECAHAYSLNNRWHLWSYEIVCSCVSFVFACRSCLCLFLHGEAGISAPCPFLNLSLCLNLCPVTSYCSFTSPPKDAAAWLVYGTDKMNRDWSKRPEVIVMSLSVPFLQAMLVFFSHPVMRQPFFSKLH